MSFPRRVVWVRQTGWALPAFSFTNYNRPRLPTNVVRLSNFKAYFSTSNIVIKWDRSLLIHFLQGMTSCILISIAVTPFTQKSKRISKFFRPYTHMASAVKTENCRLLELCKAVYQRRSDSINDKNV